MVNFGWAFTELPYWQNHFLRANVAHRLAGVALNATHRLYDHGYTRLQDFVNRHGILFMPAICGAILSEDDYSLQCHRRQHRRLRLGGALHRAVIYTEHPLSWDAREATHDIVTGTGKCQLYRENAQRLVVPLPGHLAPERETRRAVRDRDEKGTRDSRRRRMQSDGGGECRIKGV